MNTVGGMSRLRIFLDANIFISACRSPKGDAGQIIETLHKGRHELVTIRQVIHQVRRHLAKKAPKEAGQRLLELAEKLSLEVNPDPNPVQCNPYRHLIADHDLPVLAAAVIAGCDYLLTLDDKDFFSRRLKRGNLPLTIIRPVDLQRLLEEHGELRL